MKVFLISTAVIIGLIIIGSISLIGVRNGVIEREEQVKGQWAEIDNQLQRRADLIPNLVNTAKGYAAHEKEVFTSIADARSRLIGAKGPQAKAEANSGLGAALGRLLMIAEKYPDLKANEQFTRLMDELAGTENRIAVARTRYNASVKDFNMTIRKFPWSMFAGAAETSRFEYFEPPNKEALQKAPEVKF